MQKNNKAIQKTDVEIHKVKEQDSLYGAILFIIFLDKKIVCVLFTATHTQNK